MRFRLRTLPIVLALASCLGITCFCAHRYAATVADMTADFVAVRLGVKMYPWLKPGGLE